MAKYVKGIIKDTGAIDQPEGSYRYAKNAILNRVKGAVINEHGNIDIADLFVERLGTNIQITVIGAITDDYFQSGLQQFSVFALAEAGHYLFGFD